MTIALRLVRHSSVCVLVTASWAQTQTLPAFQPIGLSNTVTVIPKPVASGDTATLIIFGTVGGKCDAAGAATATPLNQGTAPTVSGSAPQPVTLNTTLKGGQTICVEEKYTLQTTPDFALGTVVDPNAPIQANNPTGPAASVPTSNESGGATTTGGDTFVIPLTEPATIPAPLVTSLQSSGKLTYDESSKQQLVNLVDEACALSIPADTSGKPKQDANLDVLKGRDKDFSTYEVFNVITLTSGTTQTVASNNWYILNQYPRWYNGFHGWKLGDFDPSTRFYGAKHIILVSIVLKYQGSDLPSIQYGTILTQQTPTNLSHAYQLLGVLFPTAQTADASGNVPGHPLLTGCTVIPVAGKFKSSTIEADTTFPAGSKSPSTAKLTFVNEPKSWWDVSFALPVTKASALTYSSTANTVTASSISKQNLFAVFDLYFPLADLKRSTALQIIPHPFAGAAITGQPLHNMLFGMSVGLHLVEVYAGALLIKQQQLSGISTGSTASPAVVSGATTYGFKPSLSVGIKISIPNAISLLGATK